MPWIPVSRGSATLPTKHDPLSSIHFFPQFQKEVNMTNGRLTGAVLCAVLSLFALTSHAQGTNGDVYWRIDPGVKSCSMVIHPSLTQAQWHRFTEQAGAILSFKSLAAAQALGKMNFTVAVDYASTPVDQHDLAWINTFVHPDEDCPLGDEITIPTIRASMGGSEKIDAGGFWTTAPNGNYGMVGAELKYAFLPQSGRIPAAAVRASMSLLTGVPDFNLNVFSADIVTSEKIARFTPYVGLKQSLAVGSETTTKVDLKRERIPITQGYMGVVCPVWRLNLAAEYDFSSVNTAAVAVGVDI